jgi:hypothetical protein
MAWMLTLCAVGLVLGTGGGTVALAQQVDLAAAGRRVSVSAHALAFEYADQNSLTTRRIVVLDR